jgi:glycogen(starch) synthase
VCLGVRRVRAAKRYTADLAAGGARVLLVAPDRPEWSELAPVDGVTVHRLGSADVKATRRAARRFLLRRGGPLADADLLVAGDMEAMPVVEEAGGVRPGLRTALEPAPEPSRRTAEADLAVVTPWYPSPDDPFAGAFVKAATGAIRGDFDRIATLHTENWYYSPAGLSGTLIRTAFDRQARRTGGRVVLDTAEGELTRVATPFVLNGNYAVWARAQIDRLRAALPTGRIEAPLIHAHTGHYAGVVATALARADARIVVTEHASFLPKVFRQKKALRLYGDMLARVDRMLCVSPYLFDQVAEQFPEYAGKLRIVPNPIDFDEFAVRPQPPAEPLRWLYVGRMTQPKGVRTVVEAFARIAAEEPRATLTLIGDGPLKEGLRPRIAELGLTDRITQRPSVPPQEVAGEMHRHDLLVHASPLETFGMTIVEAVATGTPVLVARSQGPAMTLAGLDGVAGALFDVTDDPEVVADAYRRLRSAWSGLDLAAARADLRSRYGREEVAARLREVYAEVLAERPPVVTTRVEPTAEVPMPAPGADRVVVVAINPNGGWRTRQYIQAARARGYAVDMIARDQAAWSHHKLDGGVTFHALGAAEERRFPRRLERFVVERFPNRVMGFLRARAARLASPMPETLMILAQRRQRRLSASFQRKVYGRWYDVTRPRVLWRLTRRDVLPRLDAQRTRGVVVHGVPGITIGAKLAALWPDVPVSTSLRPPAEEASVHG